MNARATLLLALGAAAGLGAAALGLLSDRSGGPALPEGAAAVVNGTVVRQAEYERAVHALASDRRDPLDEADRRFVLDRLVDEELLVQRGLELGLARFDRRVRADLVQAVIQSVVAEAEQTEPDEDAVRAFYEENGDYFTRPGRMRVRRIWVKGAADDPGARERAAEAARRLRAGDPFETVAEELGDAVVARVPDAPLPATKLREYLGPTAVRALAGLDAGAVADPIATTGGFHVLWLVAEEPAAVPPLAEIEPEVRAELRRRRGDRALRAYLDELRERADVQLANAP